MAKDQFGFGTKRPTGKLERLQSFIDEAYYYDEIKAPIPIASIKNDKLHVEVGQPPENEEAYIEWLRGVEMMDESLWDDTKASLRDAGVSERTSNIVYTIDNKPISKHKGFLGIDFLKNPGTDFIGGLPR